MTYTGFRFGGRNARLQRPTDKPPVVTGDTWAVDRAQANADDGTEIDATWANRIKAALEKLVTGLGGDLNDGDQQLLNAVLAKLGEFTPTNELIDLLAGKLSYGSTLDALSDGAGYVRMTSAERTKLAVLAANFKGAYSTLTALQVALPSATAGDWAILTKDSGAVACFAVWDSDNSPAAWVDTGASTPTLASGISVVPAGNIAATNVQAALQELDTEKEPALGYTPPDASSFIGQVAWFAKNTPPTGWLKANGALLSRTTYSALFGAIGTAFGAGDGSTTFQLPDMRGEFPRGWDDGRGTDTGRAFGSSQADAFQGHRHDAAGTNAQNSGNGTYITRGSLGSWAVQSITAGAILDPTSDGSNGTPRIAAETRPRNVALLACIRY